MSTRLLTIATCLLWTAFVHAQLSCTELDGNVVNYYLGATDSTFCGLNQTVTLTDHFGGGIQSATCTSSNSPTLLSQSLLTIASGGDPHIALTSSAGDIGASVQILASGFYEFTATTSSSSPDGNGFAEANFNYETVSFSNQMDSNSISVTTYLFQGQVVPMSVITSSSESIASASFTFKPVPEPASIATLSLGVLIMVSYWLPRKVKNLT